VKQVARDHIVEEDEKKVLVEIGHVAEWYDMANSNVQRINSATKKVQDEMWWRHGRRKNLEWDMTRMEETGRLQRKLRVFQKMGVVE